MPAGICAQHHDTNGRRLSRADVRELVSFQRTAGDCTRWERQAKGRRLNVEAGQRGAATVRLPTASNHDRMQLEEIVVDRFLSRFHSCDVSHLVVRRSLRIVHSVDTEASWDAN